MTTVRAASLRGPLQSGRFSWRRDTVGRRTCAFIASSWTCAPTAGPAGSSSGAPDAGGKYRAPTSGGGIAEASCRSARRGRRPAATIGRRAEALRRPTRHDRRTRRNRRRRRPHRRVSRLLAARPHAQRTRRVPQPQPHDPPPRRLRAGPSPAPLARIYRVDLRPRQRPGVGAGVDHPGGSHHRASAGPYGRPRDTGPPPGGLRADRAGLGLRHVLVYARRHA